jgi:hypothetical protein
MAGQAYADSVSPIFPLPSTGLPSRPVKIYLFVGFLIIHLNNWTGTLHDRSL